MEPPQIDQPSDPRGNGRGANGKFLPGNKCGRGSPLAGMASKLRAAMLKAVKVGDVKSIIGAMIAKAQGGDVAAAKLVLQYTMGEPQPFDLIERLEQLEAARDGRQENEPAEAN